jgi:hypothetical protein|tara:strand:+ start:357 stop:1985 length:1629 start_codon:yes stop_codon:yes gene_type:complete
MASDPNLIAKRLREQRKQVKDETVVLNEQLALVDVIIDEYDDLIIKLDKKIQPLLPPINYQIDQVQKAYLDRISHGCRSDLTWQLKEEKEMNIYNNPNQEVKIYEVVKDPSTFRFLGYYGAKYYKYPKNREYGSNVVETINDADANVGSKILPIFDADAETLTGFTTGRLSGIKTGDFITDSLSYPYIFQAGAGTSITGFGLTDYAKYNYAVSGFCTSGDNKIYGDQRIGFITDFSIGDEVYGAPDRSGAGIIPTGTTITGFGTAVGIVTFVNSAGITTGVEVTLDFATLSNAVTNNINKDIGTSFYVGVVSSYYYADLSAAPNATGISSSFIIIRPGDLTNIEFESTKNPIDPVEIGIARGANIGKGHRLELINNGDPDITAQWREIIEDPEPAVGAGRVEYYIGTTQWPTISRRDSDGDVFTTHATLGQRVIVGVGATIGAGIGYTGNPPGGNIPSDCGTYDTAIIDAETELQNLIIASTPKINHYINGADSLRQLRDDDETKAWGYLQAIGFNNAKASRQLSQAETIEDFNWPDVGITT